MIAFYRRAHVFTIMSNLLGLGHCPFDGYKYNSISIAV